MRRLWLAPRSRALLRGALLAACFLALLGGCSSGGADRKALVGPASYEVTGSLRLTPQGLVAPSSLTLPTAQSFLLYVDPETKTLVASSATVASRVAASSRDNVSFAATDALYVPLGGPPCGASTTYASFQLAVDAHGLSGTAVGTAEIVVGDVGYSYKAELTFSGVPDRTGPTADVSAQADPLEGARFKLSEPIPGGATARLASASQTVELIPGTVAGAVTSFSVPLDVVLRYGASYELEISPWEDLVGQAGGVLPSVSTPAPPPLIAEDGFEGGATQIGGALVVDASVLPPISGTRSALVQTASAGRTLVVGATSALTARLAVAPGDTVVRVAVRPFSAFQVAATYEARLRVAAPGGGVVAASLPGSEDVTVEQVIVKEQTVYLGAVRTVELPLPAGASSEVVFDLRLWPSFASCGLPSPRTSYLIDDLRVE